MRRHIPLPASLLLLACLAAAGAPAAPAPTTTPSDLLQSRTFWKGQERNTEKNKPKQHWPCTARVVKRDGDKVALNFYVAGDDGRRGCQMEGTIDADGKLLFKVTKTLPGDAWPETIVGTHMTGTVNGDSLVINRKSRHGVSLAAEMKLVEKDKDKD